MDQTSNSRCPTRPLGTATHCVTMTTQLAGDKQSDCITRWGEIETIALHCRHTATIYNRTSNAGTKGKVVKNNKRETKNKLQGQYTHISIYLKERERERERGAACVNCVHQNEDIHVHKGQTRY